MNIAIAMWNVYYASNEQRNKVAIKKKIGKNKLNCWINIGIEKEYVIDMEKSDHFVRFFRKTEDMESI